MDFYSSIRHNGDISPESYPVATFELRRLEIFLKINVDHIFGFRKNNLGQNGLNYCQCRENLAVVFRMRVQSDPRLCIFMRNIVQ